MNEVEEVLALRRGRYAQHPLLVLVRSRPPAAHLDTPWDIFGRKSSRDGWREMPGPSRLVVEAIVAQGRDKARQESVGKASQCTLVAEATGAHRPVERVTVRIAARV